MRTRGRPAIGRAINIRLEKWMLRQVDDYARGYGISRAEAIRRLIEQAIQKTGGSDGPGATMGMGLYER